MSMVDKTRTLDSEIDTRHEEDLNSTQGYLISMADEINTLASEIDTRYE